MKNDCDLIVNDIEGIFSSFDNCLDTVIDDKKSKMNVAGGVFGFGMSLTKLVCTTAICAVKNAPKALLTVSALKKEVVNGLGEAVHIGTKEWKKFSLDMKIEQLKLEGKKR